MTTYEDKITDIATTFNIHFEGPSFPHDVSGEKLLETNVLQTWVDRLQTSPSAPPLAVASIFSKYYSMLVAVSSMYAFSHHDLHLDMNLNRIRLYAEEPFRPHLYIRKPETMVPSRTKARANLLHTVFAENLQPVFHALHNLTGIAPRVLWANASNTIYWHYEQWMKKSPDTTTLDRIRTDFHYFTREARGPLFGVEGANPLYTEYSFVAHPIHPNETVKIRKVCCLKYMLPSGTCCYTCPKLAEDERSRMIKELAAGRS